jgi:pentatricopeptide repeat protein
MACLSSSDVHKANALPTELTEKISLAKRGYLNVYKQNWNQQSDMAWLHSVTAGFRANLMCLTRVRYPTISHFAIKRHDPAIHQINQSLHELCKRQSYGEVVRFWRKLLSEKHPAPNTRTLNHVIQAYRELGQPEDALDLFRNPPKGCKPDVATYTQVITVAGHTEGLVDELSLFKEAIASGVKPNVRLCCALITAFARHSKMEDAQLIVDWMEKNKIGHSSHSISALIHGYARAGEFDPALKLLADIQERTPPGVQPSEAACHAVLSAASRHRNVEAADICLHHMKRLEIPFSAATHTLRALCYARASEVQRAIGAYEDLVAASGVPSIALFNTLLYACASGMKKHTAWWLLDEMQKWQCEPTASTLQSLVSVCASVGELERASSLLLRMSESDRENPVLLASVLSAMARRGKWREALRLTHQLGYVLPPEFIEVEGSDSDSGSGEEEVSVPSVQAPERTDLPQASGTMGEKSLSLTPVLLNVLLHALCKGQQVEKAMQLKAMVNLEADSFTVCTLLDGLGRAGLAKEAAVLWEDWLAAGNEPTTIGFTSLIVAFSRSQNWPQVESSWNQMVERGVAPNAFTYNALIHARCLAGDMDGALEAFEDMKKQGHKASSVTATSFLRSGQNAAAIEKALGHLQQGGVHLDRVLSNAMRSAAVRLQLPPETYQAWLARWRKL